MILFLDFDGVLHPEAGEESGTFCCRPVLWQVLRKQPQARVVFSTSWRLVYDQRTLVNLVTDDGGEDLRERFIGQTPALPVASDADDYRQREIECLAWLSANQRGASCWLALDDVEHWFSDSSPNLYLVDYMTGLVEEDIPLILDKLR